MWWRDLPGLLLEAGREWWEANTFRLGAALSFYTLFSLAPVLLITIAVVSLVLGAEGPAARQQIINQISETVGSRVGSAIETTIESAEATGSGPLATLISVVFLLVGATAVFGELQDALNTIWGVKARSSWGLWNLLKDRFWSFTAVLGTAFLLLVSLIVSAILAGVARFLTPSALPGGAYVWQLVNFLLSLAFITLLFAMIYKVLPDVNLSWQDVGVGAFVTALLFNVGKYLIGLYLAHSTLISAYGAAGSLVIILLWVFYSSQILLYGAEFTQVYANKYGRPMVETEKAEPVTEKARAMQEKSEEKQARDDEHQRAQAG